MRMNKNKCFLCILKEPILIWPLDLTEIIKTCFMLGCYTAIFNITAETLGPQSTGKFFPKNQSCALVLKKIHAHIELLQRYLVKLHFLLKNNNFLLMNPLLAAIDLQEALPRVIHDHDKKIHCRIQTEILLHRVVWIATEVENQSFCMTRDLMLAFEQSNKNKSWFVRNLSGQRHFYIECDKFLNHSSWNFFSSWGFEAQTL